jgi:hypothetical protein
MGIQRMKKMLTLVILLVCSSACAEEASGALSDECIRSATRLYRFYFHEIYPNPKVAACKSSSETLGPQETAEMQMVVTELKTNCPAEFIAKINNTLRKAKTEEKT